MNKYFTLLLLLLPCILHSQIDSQFLKGEWIMVNNRMQDGSKNVSQRFLVSKFNRWRISDKKICMDVDPISSSNQSCLDYKLENNFIRTSLDSGYQIAKLTQDSLVILQQFKGVNELDKLAKLWFTRSSTLKNEYVKKHKNDTILFATAQFTPTIDKFFFEEITKTFRKKSKYPNFLLMGNIILYPKEGTLKVEIENADDKSVIENRTSVGQVTRLIESTYSDWRISDFKNFNTVYIPFMVKSESIKFKGGSLQDSRIFYFVNDIADIKNLYGITLNDLKLSGESFQKGILSFEEKRYEEAIDFFMKAYELDDRKIDALYNIAAIHSLLNDKKRMCDCLKKLKDLEQTQGINLYNENCEL